MHRTPVYVPGLVLLLVACLLIVGCSTSDMTNQTAQSGTTTQTTQTGTITTETTAGALYTAGDIVKNPASTASSAWLVIRYDPASDTYERALIFKNADGSWGYRSDDRTETASRSVMEKTYTEKIATRDPSSVPVVTPTKITTEQTTRAAATSAITTATTTDISQQQPYVERSIPDSGYTGTTVAITDLVGNNFLAGASVYLSRNDSSSIAATDVKVLRPKSITCSFAIPENAPVGAWDLTVKNPNGMSGTYTNYFTIHRDMSVAETTSATHAGTVPITAIDPPFGHIGYMQYVITGSQFQSGATVKLQQTGSTDIDAIEVIQDSDTQIRCFINIPVGSMGSWDLLVTNPGGSYGKLIGSFPIN
jgi:hypothetical protein